MSRHNHMELGRRGPAGWRFGLCHRRPSPPSRPMVPEQPPFPAQGKITYVPRDSILEFKALPEYQGAGLGHRKIRQDRQAAAGGRAAAEGAAGLQDRQHARRHRRLWRHDAPRHRRPAGRLELLRRPDPGLGRHRHRHVRMPDAHRAAVPGRGQGHGAAAEPGQELGRGPTTATC